MKAATSPTALDPRARLKRLRIGVGVLCALILVHWILLQTNLPGLFRRLALHENATLASVTPRPGPTPTPRAFDYRFQVERLIGISERLLDLHSFVVTSQEISALSTQRAGYFRDVPTNQPTVLPRDRGTLFRDLAADKASALERLMDTYLKTLEELSQKDKAAVENEFDRLQRSAPDAESRAYVACGIARKHFQQQLDTGTVPPETATTDFLENCMRSKSFIRP